MEFLALRISTNVRVLEGALTRLFAFASLVGRHITLEVTQDCLADILRASERKITVEEIQRKVSEHYNIRLSDTSDQSVCAPTPAHVNCNVFGKTNDQPQLT